MTTAEKMAKLGARIWNGEEVSAADRLARLGIVADGATEEQKELAREYLRMQQRDDATYLKSIAGWQTQPVKKGGGRETGHPNPVQHPVYGYGQANMQPVSAEPLVGTPEWVEWNRQREQEQLQTQQLLTGKKPKDPQEMALDKARETDWVNSYSELYAALPRQIRDDFEKYAKYDSIDATLEEDTQLKAAGEWLALKRKLKKQMEDQGLDWKEMESYAQLYVGRKQAMEEKASSQAYANNHGAGASVASIGYNMTAPVQAADSVLQWLDRKIRGSDAPINTYSDAQRAGRRGETMRGTVSGNIRENHGELAGFVYDTAMSGADSVASLATGPAAAFVLGSSAGASTVRQAMDDGVTSEQALQLGFAAAVAEGVFEKLSLGNLKSFKNVEVKTLRDAVLNQLKTMGVNASEEAATELANMVAEQMIRQDESELRRAGQAAYDAAIAEGRSPEEAEKEARRAMAAMAGQRVGLAAAGGALMGFAFGVPGNAYAAWNTGRKEDGQAPQNPGGKPAEKNILAGTVFDLSRTLRKASYALQDDGRNLPATAAETLQTVPENSPPMQTHTAQPRQNTQEHMGGLLSHPLVKDYVAGGIVEELVGKDSGIKLFDAIESTYREKAHQVILQNEAGEISRAQAERTLEKLKQEETEARIAMKQAQQNMQQAMVFKAAQAEDQTGAVKPEHVDKWKESLDNESKISENWESDEQKELAAEAKLLLSETGEFIDPALEWRYRKYVKQKEKTKQPKERLAWKKASEYMTCNSPVARGNRFNQKAKDSNRYRFHEVYLANGKRLDSYAPLRGEIVSRKAIYLDKLRESKYREYLSEFTKKYSVGTEIKSEKYKELKGKVLKGRYILEIPASNAKLKNIKHYREIAAEYNVKLRFLRE